MTDKDRSLAGKTKKFLARILDVDTPPPVPNASTSNGQNSHYQQTPPPAVNPDFVSAFDSLALSVKNDRPNFQDPAFIGGFNPYHNGSPGAHQGLGALPRPPPMPVPYGPISPQNSSPHSSMTMQYALGSNPHLLTPAHGHQLAHSAPTTPMRPQPIPGATQHYPFNNSPSGPTTPNSARPARPVVVPQASKRPRANSTPPTPIGSTAGSSQTQCAGTTKAGKQCTRQVKNAVPALTHIVPSNIERYCFQHTKDLLVPTGFYSRKLDANGNQTSNWVDFIDWIPPYLHPDTQVALRVEMEKARSQSDVEGYIYTFEIRDPKAQASNAVLLKVGRTANVVKRLHQWGKQCGSKEQVLRGWYPGDVDDDDDTANGSLMKGRIRAGGQGTPSSHRLERLIHLEIADLAVNQAYLDPKWRSFRKGVGKGSAQQPKQTIATVAPVSPPTTPAKSRGRKASSASDVTGGKASFVVNGMGNGGGNGPCKDCGSMHKEIFSFEKVPKGLYKSREWDGIVKEVIDGWGTFVKEYV